MDAGHGVNPSVCIPTPRMRAGSLHNAEADLQNTSISDFVSSFRLLGFDRWGCNDGRTGALSSRLEIEFDRPHGYITTSQTSNTLDPLRTPGKSRDVCSARMKDERFEHFRSEVSFEVLAYILFFFAVTPFVHEVIYQPMGS